MFTCCSVSPLSHCEDSWNIHSNWLETFLSYNNMTHVNFFSPPTRPLVSLISGVHRGRRARKSHSAMRSRQNSHPVWMALQMAPLRTEPQQLIEMWLKSQRSPVQYPNLSSCIFLIKAKKPSHFFLKRKKKIFIIITMNEVSTLQGHKHSHVRKTWARQNGLPPFYETKRKEEHGLGKRQKREVCIMWERPGWTESGLNTLWRESQSMWGVLEMKSRLRWVGCRGWTRAGGRAKSVFMDVVKVCRSERRGCGGEGKQEAAAQNRSKQDL